MPDAVLAFPVCIECLHGMHPHWLHLWMPSCEPRQPCSAMKPELLKSWSGKFIILTSALCLCADQKTQLRSGNETVTLPQWLPQWILLILWTTICHIKRESNLTNHRPTSTTNDPERPPYEKVEDARHLTLRVYIEDSGLTLTLSLPRGLPLMSKIVWR